MNENINIDEKEKDDFLDEREKFNPVGTKILVEVEVIRDNGFTELTASMFNKNKSKEFEDLLGVKINKIYHKDVTIPFIIKMLRFQMMMYKPYLKEF